MSTITREFTKEQLIAKAREQIAFCRNTKITGEGRAHVNQCSELFEIALAALTAKPIAWLNDAYLARGVVDGEAGSEDAGPGYIPVYREGR